MQLEEEEYRHYYVGKKVILVDIICKNILKYYIVFKIKYVILNC